MNLQVKWLMGAFVMLLGMVGLYLAVHATDGGLYFAGLAIFVTCLLYVLLQIKLTYDQRPTREAKGEEVGTGQSG